MKKIQFQKYSRERALYNISDTKLLDCIFTGDEDGESPLKECTDIKLVNCMFDLRYALWHDKNVECDSVTFTDKCRAPLWYSNDIRMNNCSISGVKTFRESSIIELNNCTVVSPEFMWRCNDIIVLKTGIEGEYAFFESKNVQLDTVTFKGKYSFQYVEGLVITNSIFDTKDAFWHSKNVVVQNSYIKGEYLGWYSENITFINCKIESHQPLCYVKGLKLIDCEFVNSDLAFEYSEVNGNIIGKIDSIKNPMSGEIKVDQLGALIREDDKYPSLAKVIVGK